ncbi:hypothetical protein KKC32_03040 [Patescibacteria group bacterium]|nr:hypothetical protein [Patescibacteria group bacterium]
MKESERTFTANGGTKKQKEPIAKTTFMEKLRRHKRDIMAGVLSALINYGPIFLSEHSDDISSNVSRAKKQIAYSLKDWSGELSKYAKEVKKSLKAELEKSEKFEDVDLLKFFLLSELAEGADPSDYEDALEIFNEDVEKFKKMSKTEPMIKVLHEMTQESGRHVKSSSYLTKLLVERQGNCEARAKLMMSFMQAVYPKAKIKLQRLSNHILVMAPVADSYYALEKPTPRKIEFKDMQDTVLYDPDVFIKLYLKHEVQGSRVISGKKVKSESAPPSDTYFHFPPVEGIKASSGSNETEAKETRYEYKPPRMIRFSFSPPKSEKAGTEAPEAESENKVESKKFEITDEFIMRAIVDNEVKIYSKEVINPERLKEFEVDNYFFLESNITDFSFLDKQKQYDFISLPGISKISFETLQGIHCTSLGLTDTGMQTADLEKLAGSEIEVLNLTKNHIIDYSSLERISGLMKLDVTLNDKSGLATLPVHKLPQLLMLDIGGTGVDNSVLANLKSDSVRILLMNSTKGISAFSILVENMPNIEELNLSYRWRSGNDPKELHFLNKLPHLRVLNLEHNDLTASELKFLEDNKTIEDLNLMGNDSSGVIAMIESMPQLKRLLINSPEDHPPDITENIFKRIRSGALSLKVNGGAVVALPDGSWTVQEREN